MLLEMLNRDGVMTFTDVQQGGKMKRGEVGRGRGREKHKQADKTCSESKRGGVSLLAN